MSNGQKGFDPTERFVSELWESAIEDQAPEAALQRTAERLGVASLVGASALASAKVAGATSVAAGASAASVKAAAGAASVSVGLIGKWISVGIVIGLAGTGVSMGVQAVVPAKLRAFVPDDVGSIAPSQKGAALKPTRQENPHQGAEESRGAEQLHVSRGNATDAAGELQALPFESKGPAMPAAARAASNLSPDDDPKREPANARAASGWTRFAQPARMEPESVPPRSVRAGSVQRTTAAFPQEQAVSTPTLTPQAGTGTEVHAVVPNVRSFFPPPNQVAASDALAHEVQLLEKARTLLAQARPAEALGVVEQYQMLYPRGALMVEARALAAMARRLSEPGEQD